MIMPEKLKNKGFGFLPVLLIAALLGTAGFVGINYFNNANGDVLATTATATPVACTGTPGTNAYKFENNKNCFYTFKSSLGFTSAMLDAMAKEQTTAKNKKPTADPDPYPNFIRPAKTTSVYMAASVKKDGTDKCIGFVPQTAAPTPITIANAKYGNSQFRVYRKVTEFDDKSKKLAAPITVAVKLSGPKIKLKKGSFGCGDVIVLRGADANVTFNSALYTIDDSGYVQPTVTSTTTTVRTSVTASVRASVTSTSTVVVTPKIAPTVTPVAQTALTPFNGITPVVCSFARPTGVTTTYSLETKAGASKGSNCFFETKYTAFNPRTLLIAMDNQNKAAAAGAKPYQGFVLPKNGRAVYYADSASKSSTETKTCLGLVPNGQSVTSVITFRDRKFGNVVLNTWQNVVTYNTGFKLDNTAYVYLRQARGPKITITGAEVMCNGVLRLDIAEYKSIFSSKRIAIDSTGFSDTSVGSTVDEFAPEYSYLGNSGKWPQSASTFLATYLDTKKAGQLVKEFYRIPDGVAVFLESPYSTAKSCTFFPNGQGPRKEKFGKSTYDLYTDVIIALPNRIGGKQAIAQTSGPKLKFTNRDGAFEKCGIIFFDKGKPLPLQ